MDTGDDIPTEASVASLARALLAPLRRDWRASLALFVLVTGAVSVGVLRSPPLYEAEASLMVRVGREYAYRPEADQAESGRMPSLAEMVHSEVEILSSADLAEQVVRALGLARLAPEIVEREPDPELATRRAVLQFRQATRVR